MANREAAHAVLVERRILFVVTVLLAIGLVLWIVAISTDYWTVVDGNTGIFVPKTKRFFVRSRNGVWRSCRTAFASKSQPSMIIKTCVNHNLFPKEGKIVDKKFLHYQRTVAAFCIISLMLMVMGLIFSVYTFKQTRYMYKRLAACNHLISAGTVLIVLEVASSLIHHEAANLPHRIPKGATWWYGFSFMLGWICFVTQVMGAVSYAICSRKRKKDKAPDDRFAIEEEPTIIGR